MKALVVYDSFYGNTQKLAEKIASTLGENAKLLKAKEADNKSLVGIDLLVIGSPTRAFNTTLDIKIFLKSLDANSLKNIKVAIFDTRVDLKETNSKFLNFLVKLFGYANAKIEKLALKKGGVPYIQSEGFFVHGSEGPLFDGELERITEWTKQLIN